MYKIKVLIQLAWVGLLALFDWGWEKVVDFGKDGEPIDKVINKL